MAADTTALAAIIRDGTEADRAAAYNSLVAICGTTEADQLWAEACRHADTTALAAVIATGDRAAIIAAYNRHVAAAGHDAAEEIYEAALQVIDAIRLAHVVAELERNTGIADPEHGGLLNMLRHTGEAGNR